MTPTEFLDNTFFAYFFSMGDYLPVLFAFAFVVALIFSFLNFFLGIDRSRP